MPRRSPCTSVTPALSMATSVPVAHRDADVGLGERRRVVDAVARHRHLAPFVLQARAIASRFSAGITSAIDVVDAEPRGDGVGGCVVCRPVSITTRRPLVAQQAQRLRRRGLDRIRDRDHAARFRPRRRRRSPSAPSAASRRRRGAPARRRRCLRRSSSARLPRTRAPAADASDHAHSRTALEVAQPSRARGRVPRAAASTARASGCSLACSSAAASCSSRRSSTPSAGTTAVTRRPALGERARLVDDERVDRAQALERLGVLHEHAGAARRVRSPTMIDIGVASPSAHGHAMISTATAFTQRVGECRRRPERRPRDEGQRRGHDHRRHEPRGDPIGEPLDRRAAALRLRDHAARSARAASRCRPARRA